MPPPCGHPVPGRCKPGFHQLPSCLAHNAHCLHLRQDLPQVIQDCVSFKVQVLCSLENLSGVQRPTKLPDFQQWKPGSPQPVCLLVFSQNLRERTQLLHTGTKSAFSWVIWAFSFHHWADKGYKNFRCNSEWHLHTPACECPADISHCSGSVSSLFSKLEKPIDNESHLTAQAMMVGSPHRRATLWSQMLQRVYIPKKLDTLSHD